MSEAQLRSMKKEFFIINQPYQVETFLLILELLMNH